MYDMEGRREGGSFFCLLEIQQFPVLGALSSVSALSFFPSTPSHTPYSP